MNTLRSAVTMKCITAVTVAAAVFAAFAGEKREVKVYAHFMGCWPAFGCDGQDEVLKNVLYGTNAYNDCANLGGRIENLPLVPQNYKAETIDTAKTEIRRAIRAGIDGFAFDAWAGDKSPQTLDVYFKAAEELKADFGLTICFDPSCHGAKWIQGGEMWERYVSSAKWVLRHLDSPNLARFHGKPLFFGYYSRGIVKRVDGESAADWRKRIRGEWEKWRKALPCEVYLHGSIEDYVDWKRIDKNDFVAIAKDCAATYDTVGAFLGHDNDWANKGDLWKLVKEAGCGWSQPLFSQYSNKAGGIITDAGLDYLHRNWKYAIERGSELLQFVTWNDYGEETILAPAYGSNYTVTRVNKYYSDWLKAGQPPKVEKDEIHVAFRRVTADALAFPFHSRRVKLPTALEVITFLTEPGTVCVDDYGEYKAPAGMFSKKFEQRSGKISVTVKRPVWIFFAKTVCSMTAPEEISDKRWREDQTMATWSSTYAEEWAIDFPGVKPLRYSENGDLDGDGLPNWFEMVYFGKFPYMETASCADPNADPDGDGFTNLQEYRNETDPNKPDTPYTPGFVWSLADFKALQFVSNPERDTKGRYVWRSEYQYGEKDHTYEPGSAFTEIWSGGGSLNRRSFHVYEPNRLGGCGFDTGVSFEDRAGGTAEIRVCRDSPVAIAWIAPVDCTVDVAVDCATREKRAKFKTWLVKDDQVLGETAAKKVAVKKGDVIRFVTRAGSPGPGDFLTVKSFTVTHL